MRRAVVAVFVVGLLAALFATKPSRDDFDRELTSILREAISSTSYDKDKGIFSNVTMLGCKLRTDDCLNILKSTYTVTNKNYGLFTRHQVAGPGASIDCWGIFRQFICNSEVSVPTVRNALQALW